MRGSRIDCDLPRGLRVASDAPGGVVIPLRAGLVGSEPHPAERLFQAMLDGWKAQQLSRGLSVVTVDARERAVRRLHVHSNEWPWLWTPQIADEWFADLRVHRRITHSTLRSLQGAVRQFCWFITDPAYPWAAQSELLFGTHPIQVVVEDNLAVHVADVESTPRKRAFTRTELQAFFDHADDQAVAARTAR